MSVFDYGALLAFAIMTVEVLVQIRYTLQRKSSVDISIMSMFLRTLAGLLLLLKYVVILDWVLIIGQGIFSLVFLISLLIVLYYRKDLKKRARSKRK